MSEQKPPTPAGSGPGATSSSEVLAKLKDLRELLDQGFISMAEYDERREQLINELTGTQRKKARLKAISQKDELPKVVARPPPTDFEAVKREKAKLHSFDPDTGKWTSREITLRIDDVPFARGALRLCYYCSLDVDPDTGEPPKPSASSSPPPAPSASASTTAHPLDQRRPGPIVFVAKLSVDPFEEKSAYYADIQVQMYSRMFAERYNGYNPPKRILFLKAYLVELIDRKSSPMCGVERFLYGSYRKHNNNFGYVSDVERSTPQAFSHFTYEASDHKLLVCDIQGVDDVYTDPQIHSLETFPLSKFVQTKGNLGERGIESFLAGHRCNAVCAFLRLPSVNPLDGLAYDAGSTMPSERYMAQQRVRVVEVQSPKANPHTPLLPPLRGGASSQSSSACPCCTLL